jgi:hypothetical protein
MSHRAAGVGRPLLLALLWVLALGATGGSRR